MSRKTKAPIAIYSALADATRCRIVEILLRGPIPVHTLADAFSISRPAISRHLRVLKTAAAIVRPAASTAGRTGLSDRPQAATR